MLLSPSQPPLQSGYEGGGGGVGGAVRGFILAAQVPGYGLGVTQMRHGLSIHFKEKRQSSTQT